MHLQKTIPFLLFLFQACFLQAQGDYTARGKVVDETGAPLPFVNVYLKNTTQGTTTNSKGRFSLKIGKDGSDSLIFQYIGFEKKTLRFREDTPYKTITLQEQQFQLPDFTVSADGRDPGEIIMDSVQKHREDYFKELTGYSADFYMKGKARLDSLPTSGLLKVSTNQGEIDSSMLGVIYLTESFSKFHYQPPDKVREEMISSKIAGDPTSFSSNRAEDLLLTPYEHTIPLETISPRDYISPIGRSADLYYRFKLLGKYQENGKNIAKIRILPEREKDPVFSGVLHVVEGEWMIKSLNWTAAKPAPLEFVDSFQVKQSYLDLGDSLWIPLSLEQSYFYNVMGFKAKHGLAGHFSEYEVGKSFEKGFFRGEVFKVEGEAREKDSVYWEDNRPVILDTTESEYYSKADSIMKVRNSRSFIDSMDANANQIGIMSILTGYTHLNRWDSLYWRVNGVLNGIQFNTVEGWVGQLRGDFKKVIDGNREWGIGAAARYGFASKKPYGKAWGRISGNPKKFERLRLEGGHYVSEINDTEPVAPIINTAYSLLWERNYRKIYEKSYLELEYRREWWNGVYGALNLEYADRLTLQNQTHQVWFPQEDRDYMDNDPYGNIILYPSPMRPLKRTYPSLLLKAGADFTFRFGQDYEMYPDRKNIIPSSYPELYISWESGLPIDNGFSQFHHLEIGVGDNWDLAMLGRSRIDVKGGTFFGWAYSGSFVPIYDEKHFKGNQTLLMNSPNEGISNNPWGEGRLSSFHALPYYEYSTENEYLEAHFQHRFNGFLFNKIPLIRRANFRAVTGVNYLHNWRGKDFLGFGFDNYMEAYFGISNILKVLRVDIAAPILPASEFNPVLRVGVEMNIGS